MGQQPVAAQSKMDTYSTREEVGRITNYQPTKSCNAEDANNIATTPGIKRYRIAGPVLIKKNTAVNLLLRDSALAGSGERVGGCLGTRRGWIERRWGLGGFGSRKRRLSAKDIEEVQVFNAW
jgi:hypothetical protein